jgi:dipeptidyl-peptidase-3
MRRLFFFAALLACKSAPPPQVPPPPPVAQSLKPVAPQFAPQPSRMLGDGVVALDAPSFAQLPRDQRMLAAQLALAGQRAESLAYSQDDRHALEVVYLLRGILTRPQVVPAHLLPPLRSYARQIWLNHGLHDAQSGRKLAPAFTAADLRAAALAAKAAGADLKLTSLEFGLRALEAVIFDPKVDARRTARGADLPQSATNLYDGVTLRDLAVFKEQAPLDSRLVKEEGVLREKLELLPSSADALVTAMTFAAPPQRALLDPLAVYLRSGDPQSLQAAQRAFFETAGQVDFFAGFLDLSADPRGMKGMFQSFVGLADPERIEALRTVAEAAPQLAQLLPSPLRLEPPPVAMALLLASSNGMPLRSSLTIGNKSVFFAAADDAGNAVRQTMVRALAEPRFAEALANCLPQQRFAFHALRELIGNAQPVSTAILDRVTLRELRADVIAHLLAPLPLARASGLFAEPQCQELWPQYLATQLFAGGASLEPELPIDSDAQRAKQLLAWWLLAKGALVERHDGSIRYLAATDPQRLRGALAELLALLQQIEQRGDSARFADLLARHASHPDAQWLAEIRDRLAAAHAPRAIRLLPPRIERDGTLHAVDDLDAAVLHDWENL